MQLCITIKKTWNRWLTSLSPDAEKPFPLLLNELNFHENASYSAWNDSDSSIHSNSHDSDDKVSIQSLVEFHEMLNRHLNGSVSQEDNTDLYNIQEEMASFLKQYHGEKTYDLCELMTLYYKYKTLMHREKIPQ